MTDKTFKTVTVNKDVLIRAPGGNKLLKLSAKVVDGTTTLCINDNVVNNVVNNVANKVPEKTKSNVHMCVSKGFVDSGLATNVGKQKLINGECVVNTMNTNRNSYIFITPCSQLPQNILSGDLTVAEINPGIGFKVRSLDPVEQTIVNTDTRVFFWYMIN